MPTTINPELAEAVLIRLRAESERRKRSQDMAEECRKSFRKFVPEAWATAEPSKPFIKNCFHIDAIGDHMQAVSDGQIQNLIIVVPPGSAKSTLVSVLFPAWKWLEDPKWRGTFASYEAGLSTRDSVRCRDLMESVWFRETFQPKWKFSTTQNEKTFYVNSEKGFRVSTSVGGRGTGWRSNFLGIDDALSTDARFSDPTLTFCIQWYENVFYNRLMDLTTGGRVVIGQRVCDNDLIGHLLRKGGYELLLIPMEYDPARSKVTSIGWKDPRKDAGDLMFEPLFPRPVIEDLKRNQEVWYTQYQGQPNVEGGGILKSHKWNYWQPPGLNLPPVRVKMPNGEIEERKAVNLPDSFDLVLQSWDCTFKDLKSSDFVCGQVHAVRGAQRFLLDQIKKKMGIVDTMAAICELSGRHPKAHLKLVEDKANGTAVVEMLGRDVPGLVLVNPLGGKVSRAAAASPELEAGNWFLPHPKIASWVGNPENPTESGFMASTTAFPFGVNDDDVDSWSQGATRIQSEKIGGVFGVSESDIRVEQFDFDPKWPRLYGLAVTWKEVAAVWMVRKPETDAYYLYSEYCVPPTSPAQHVAEIIKPGDWIQGIITPTDTGRDEKDGYAMIGKYRNLKLKLDSIRQNEESHILELQGALREGKLKVFGNLSSFLNQYRSYRRDDNGKLPNHSCGLIKAALVAWAGRARMKAPMEPPKPDRASVYRNGPPSGSWMGN